MPPLLYLDLQHGLSGDMLLAALLGCCEDPAAAIRDLEALDLGAPFRLDLATVRRSSIDTLHVDVRDGSGNAAEGAAAGAHGEHRPLSEILRIIDRSALSASAKQRAGAVFRRLGEVEAAAHGIEIEAVHFHEVGALDSLVDIVGACFLLDRLGIAALRFGPLCFGRGTVRTAHGTLPIPVPAVARLAEGYRVRQTDIAGELLTPTAAALLTTLGEQVDELAGRLRKTLLVSGCRHYAGTPGFVRISLLEAAAGLETSTQYVLAVNLDDISGERAALAVERSLEAGARDAWTEAITMKKGRPALKLCVLTDAKHRTDLEARLLADTGAWGLRTQVVTKRELPRSEQRIETPYGTLRCKVGTLPDGSVRRKWAWDDLVAAAREQGLGLTELLDRLSSRDA